MMHLRVQELPQCRVRERSLHGHGQPDLFPPDTRPVSNGKFAFLRTTFGTGVLADDGGLLAAIAPALVRPVTTFARGPLRRALPSRDNTDPRRRRRQSYAGLEA